MSIEPLVSQIIAPANNFLWAVKTYLDLISGTDLLTPGSGLKRLYVMSSGVTTFNDDDISAITAKAEETKAMPSNLRGFMNQCVAKNLSLYGLELHRIIAERVIDISNGTIANPDSFVTGNADEARRYFYVPPVTFLTRLKKALGNDGPLHDYGFIRGQAGVLVTPLNDVANDAELILSQMQGMEGYATSNETSWVAMMKMVEGLSELLSEEAKYSGLEANYKNRARAALKILWVIAKLVMGDLTVNPQRRDQNLIDLDQTLNMTDGTLASIPFPLQRTVEVFEDAEAHGISMRGRFYLSAVSAASFYRNRDNDD